MAKTKMNPIWAKELRLGARSIRLPLTVMFYDLLLALVAVIAIFVIGIANSNGNGDLKGYLYIYQILGWIQMGITLLIVPILTAGTISGEREKQTLEIMLTTPKKSFSIIWGKYISAISNYMIYIISSIPIMAISFVLGGLNWFALFGYLFMMLVIAMFVGSIGIFCSSVFKKTIVSVVLTFIIEIAILSVPYIIFFTGWGISEIVFESIFYSYQYTGPIPDENFWYMVPIMFLNPLSGFFDYMLRSMDVSSIAKLFDNIDRFGFMRYVAEAWIPLNLITSFAITYGFLSLAAARLNPVKKMKKRNKKSIQAQAAQMAAQQQATQQMQPQLYQPQQQISEPQQAVQPQQVAQPQQAVQPQQVAQPQQTVQAQQMAPQYEQPQQAVQPQQVQPQQMQPQQYTPQPEAMGNTDKLSS